jgi:hypothetical protein
MKAEQNIAGCHDTPVRVSIIQKRAGGTSITAACSRIDGNKAKRLFYRKMSSPVFCPGGFIVTLINQHLLTIADRFQTRWSNTHIDKKRFHTVCTPIAKCQVILGCTTLITVPLY